MTAPVAKGELVQVATATGTLNPVINVQVGSQISGNILKLYADFNSKVKENQLVAELDPAIYKAAADQDAGDLANAKAALELAQINAKRSAALLKNALIPESDNDAAVGALHQAEAVVLQKQAALDRSKLDLDHCKIYSPIDGVVISRNVDVGQTVAASLSAPVIFSIAKDLTKMQIDSSVSEADVGGVEEGQDVNFTVDAFPGRNFVGKVAQTRNSPTNIQNVVTYDSVISVNNADLKLRPGMTANVSITTSQKQGVLKIPNAALRFKPPELTTNETFFAKVLASLGFGKKAEANGSGASSKGGAGTNALAMAKAGDTNGVPAEAPLTGNEAPEEYFRRRKEIRESGGEVPEAAQARMKERMASGEVKRPGGGGGGGGGGAGGGDGSGAPPKPRNPTGPVTRTVYLLETNMPSDGGLPIVETKPVRVKVGITDGTVSEIISGLKEGDSVVTSVRLPQSASAGMAAPSGQSPFGGSSGRFGR
jgi:HlyD family secretion protein